MSGSRDIEQVLSSSFMPFEFSTIMNFPRNYWAISKLRTKTGNKKGIVCECNESSSICRYSI